MNARPTLGRRDHGTATVTAGWPAIPLGPVEPIVSPCPLADVRHEGVDVRMHARQKVSRVAHHYGRREGDTSGQLARVAPWPEGLLGVAGHSPEPAAAVVGNRACP